MGKGCLPQPVVHLHFNDGGLGTGDVVDYGGGTQGQQVRNDKGNDGVQSPAHHEMIQSVPLEQGQKDVHTAAHQSQEDHGQQHPLDMPQEGQKPADAEKFQMGLLFFFQGSVTSCKPVCAS